MEEKMLLYLEYTVRKGCFSDSIATPKCKGRGLKENYHKSYGCPPIGIIDSSTPISTYFLTYGLSHLAFQ